MAKETKYSIRNLQRDFPTDEACLEFLFTTLHSKECSCGGNYKPLFRWNSTENKLDGRKQYQCSKCRFQIAPTAGTIFHKSDTPLSLWFHAIWIFSNAKSGISAKELERQLGVTYKCAWRILDRIRQALKQPTKKLRGDVEIDIGYLGGKGNAGKDNVNLSEVIAQKVKVIVAVERGGSIRAQIIPDSTTSSVSEFVRNNVETVATSILTDASAVYKDISRTHDRYSVNHSKGEYVRDDIHVNTIETFFAHLKRSIKGTYKTISKKHLQSYLDAFVFHYNNRHNDNQRFSALLGALLSA